MPNKELHNSQIFNIKLITQDTNGINCTIESDAICDERQQIERAKNERMVKCFCFDLVPCRERLSTVRVRSA